MKETSPKKKFELNFNINHLVSILKNINDEDPNMITVVASIKGLTMLLHDSIMRIEQLEKQIEEIKNGPPRIG